MFLFSPSYQPLACFWHQPDTCESSKPIMSDAYNAFVSHGVSANQITRYERMVNETFYLLDWKTIEEEDIDANIHFIVSGSSHNVYTVKVHDNNTITCNCPDALAPSHETCLCKHCCFVLAKIGKIEEVDVYRTGRLNADSVGRLESMAVRLSCMVQPCYIPRNDDSHVVMSSTNVDAFAAHDCRNLGEECSICMTTLQPLDINNIIKCKDCQVGFHAQCIQRWVERTVKCPTCRSSTWSELFTRTECEYYNISLEHSLIRRGRVITQMLTSL